MAICIGEMVVVYVVKLGLMTEGFWLIASKDCSCLWRLWSPSCCCNASVFQFTISDSFSFVAPIGEALVFNKIIVFYRNHFYLLNTPPCGAGRWTGHYSILLTSTSSSKQPALLLQSSSAKFVCFRPAKKVVGEALSAKEAPDSDWLCSQSSWPLLCPSGESLDNSKEPSGLCWRRPDQQWYVTSSKHMCSSLNNNWSRAELGGKRVREVDLWLWPAKQESHNVVLTQWWGLCSWKSIITSEMGPWNWSFCTTDSNKNSWSAMQSVKKMLSSPLEPFTQKSLLFLHAHSSLE